ncbi:MAG: phage head closure protein [Vallitalea sp.]|jgi:SPP1 family predicted phage head-tail adaptor|nr:phage head closure protein [Vallitalea sp.]
MDPGKLNTRIILEKYVANDDDIITTGKWEKAYDIYANANNLGYKEFWKAKECGYEGIVVFRVRYRKEIANIDPREYRIKWKDKLFNIIAPPDNIQFSNRILKIRAREVVIDG